MASSEIIIVSWNGGDDTIRAVEGCLLQTGIGGNRRDDVTISVVDNGSTDGTGTILRRRFPGLNLVTLDENRGFTGGVMAGALRSSADYLILLNNDATPEPGWLDASVRALEESDPSVIAAAGRMLDNSGTKVDFVNGVMTFDGHGFQPGFGRPLDEVVQSPAGTEVFFASGGNMIVRRKEFLDLGGLDDDFFAYFEDIDFGWRSWQAGYRTIWNPDATVRHRSQATSSRLGDFERGVLFERNAIQMTVKNLDDEMFSKLAGPIFLTLLHRLHRYSTERNDRTSALTRPPLDAPDARSPRRSEKAVIDDPLTAMQFRAIQWFFDHNDRIMEKRAATQARRRVSDREILTRFPPYIVPTYPADERLFSSKLFESLWPDLAKEIWSLGELQLR